MEQVISYFTQYGLDWLILLVAAIVGLWLERTKAGSVISGVVLTMIIAFVLSNTIKAPGAHVNGLVWGYIVPVAIPLLLFRANLVKIFREAGPTLVAFGLGTAGTIAGTIVAFYLLPAPSGIEGTEVASFFSATYTGGTMNLMSVARALELDQSSNIIVALNTADNLVMLIFFVILFTLPSVNFIARWYPAREIDDENRDPKPVEEDGRLSSWIKTVLLILAAILISTIFFLIARQLEILFKQWFNWGGGLEILILTALTVLAATLFHSPMQKLAKGEKAGIFLMQVFFAAIGATANLSNLVEYGLLLLAFALIVLFIHLTFLLTSGYFFRLSIKELVVASNANLGGPSTAAGMAISKK